MKTIAAEPAKLIAESLSAERDRRLLADILRLLLERLERADDDFEVSKAATSKWVN